MKPHTRSTNSRRIVVVAAAGVAAVVGFFAVRATAAPAPFLLAFDGAHFADSTFADGIRHEGRFTASPPFCSAGRAYDVRHVIPGAFLDVDRIHVCDDGTGSFTAFMPTVRGEHDGTGTWKIVAGTGQYAALRGFGTYNGTRISGNPDVFETIVYRTEWQGVVGFDAEPPTIDGFSATARKVRQRPVTYELRIGLSARDASMPVSYTLDIRSGRATLAFKQGSIPSGEAAAVVRIRPSRAVNVRVLLIARDALGNEASAARTVRLR